MTDESQINVQCVSTPTKGRGMVTLTDIPQASLLHSEEPYATVWVVVFCFLINLEGSFFL